MLHAWLGQSIIFWGVKCDSLEGDFNFTNVSFNINNSIDFFLINFRVRELSSPEATFWDRCSFKIFFLLCLL